MGAIASPRHHGRRVDVAELNVHAGPPETPASPDATTCSSGISTVREVRDELTRTFPVLDGPERFRAVAATERAGLDAAGALVAPARLVGFAFCCALRHFCSASAANSRNSNPKGPQFVASVSQP